MSANAIVSAADVSALDCDFASVLHKACSLEKLHACDRAGANGKLASADKH